MAKEPVLVIMAAGMGSRFGGLKQMTPVDDRGDFILDFSLFDAYRAGFRRVAFVIKQEMEDTFRQVVGARVEPYFQVDYVHQELTDLPQGFSVPAGRVKPWGTGHAAVCCRKVVDGPFVVINSDDFYGPSAFSAIYDFLTQNEDENCYAMVGYRLKNTVTQHGSVARGVCRIQDGLLTEVVEHTKIFQEGSDARSQQEDGTFLPLSGQTIVSMNFWGFTGRMMTELWDRFPGFLRENLPKNPEKCEYYLPYAVNAQLQEGVAKVRVLPCEEKWYGVTYADDLQGVKDAIAAMKQNGLYPETLW